MYMCSTVSAMKAKATRKKGRGVTDEEGPTGGTALRCEMFFKPGLCWPHEPACLNKREAVSQD